MKYETILRINNVGLTLAALAIVAIMILFYLVAKENAMLAKRLSAQEALACKLLKELSTSIPGPKKVASDLLDAVSIEQALKVADSYCDSVRESLTKELWTQYRERCAKEEEKKDA